MGETLGCKKRNPTYAAALGFANGQGIITRKLELPKIGSQAGAWEPGENVYRFFLPFRIVDASEGCCVQRGSLFRILEAFNALNAPYQATRLKKRTNKHLRKEER